jgi:hypothetical protein
MQCRHKHSAIVSIRLLCPFAILKYNIEKTCLVRVVVNQTIENWITIKFIHAAPNVSSMAVDQSTKLAIANNCQVHSRHPHIDRITAQLLRHDRKKQGWLKNKLI